MQKRFAILSLVFFLLASIGLGLYQRSWQQAKPALAFTWSTVMVDPGNASTVDFAVQDANNIFISYVESGNCKLAKSTNAGLNWTTSTIVLSPCTLGNLAVIDSNTLGFVYYTGSVTGLKFTKYTISLDTWTAPVTIAASSNGSSGANSIAAVDANTFYVSYYGDLTFGGRDLHLAKTIDGGANWTLSLVDDQPINGQTGQRAVLQALDANNVFIAYQVSSTNQVRLAKTSNGGGSWTITNVETSPIYSIGSDNIGMRVIDVNTIYLGYDYSCGGNCFLEFAKSINGGGSWTYAVADSVPGPFASAGFAPDLFAYDSNNIFATDIDVTVGSDLRVAYSTNAGATWNAEVVDPDGAWDTTAVWMVGPSSAYIAYTKDSNGDLMFAYNAAANAAPVVGYTVDNVIPAAQVTQATNGSGVVTVNFKVYDAQSDNVTLKNFGYSIDGGATYIDVSNASAAFGGSWPSNGGGGFTTTPAFGSTYSFTVNTRHMDINGLNNVDASNIYFHFKANDGTADSGYAVTDAFTLDNAVPFSPLAWTTTAVPGALPGWYTDIDAVDANTIAIASRGGAGDHVLRFSGSIDGGSNFTTTTVDLTEGEEPSIDAVDANTIYIADGANNGLIKLFKSIDGGANWNASTIQNLVTGSGGAAPSISAVDANNIYVSYIEVGVSNNLRVAVSTNAGGAWAISTVGQYAANGDNLGNNSLDTVDANTAFVSYWGFPDNDLHVTKTINGGGLWTDTDVDDNGLLRAGRFNSLQAIDANTVYVGYEYELPSGASVIRFAKSTDGGTTWSTTTVDTNYAYSVGQGNATTLRATDANHIYIIYDRGGTDVVLASSNDAGSHWSHETVATAGTINGVAMAAVNAYTIYSTFGNATLQLSKSALGAGGANIQSRPTSGSAVTLTAAMTETNPNTNDFYAERNNAGYGPVANGTANTASPAAQATQVGSFPDGDDLITKAKLVHTDDLGNVGTNETTTLASSLATVMPLVPDAPTVAAGVSSALVTVNPNAGELGDVQYSIRFVDGGTQYVQIGGAIGATPAFQTYTQWGGASGVTVTGLTGGTLYAVSTNARNPNGDNPESAYSTTTPVTPTSPPPGGGGGSVQHLLPAAPTISGQPPQVLGTDQIRWQFTDQATNESGFRLYSADQQLLVESAGSNQSWIDEGGLSANTEYSGRSIVAYNANGESAAAQLEAAVTAMVDPSIFVLTRSSDSIRLTTAESMPNVSVGQSGTQFQLMDQNSNVFESPWVQEPYTFSGLGQQQHYLVRVRARNQVGLETAWSQFVDVTTLFLGEQPQETPAPQPAPTPEPTPTPTQPSPAPAPTPTPAPAPEPTPRSRSTFTPPTTTIAEPVPSQEPVVLSTITVVSADFVGEDLVSFTGGSNPDSRFTLVFNDTVFITVTSDLSGRWQTYVSAVALGIEPGQEQNVRIEAIANETDPNALRTLVGYSRIVRPATPPLPTVTSESRVGASVLSQAADAVRQNEPAIHTTLGVTLPVVLVSSAPLWGYLPYAPTLLFHLLSYLFGFITRRKSSAAFFGIAYDSITKQPLPLAIIRVFRQEAALPGAVSVGAAAATTSKLVTTSVTDRLGRYDFLLEPGRYTLQVVKPTYQFPSRIVTTDVDATFQHVYDEHAGIEVTEQTITIPDVPLDPINAKRTWVSANGFKKLWLAFQAAGRYAATPILWVGLITSIVATLVSPNLLINWVLVALYLLMLSLELILRPKAEKPWGIVFDQDTHAILPLTTLQLIDPQYGKIMITRLSDYEGRFSFLPEAGHYVLKAVKPGYEQVAQTTLAIATPTQRVNEDVAMRALV